MNSIWTKGRDQLGNDWFPILSNVNTLMRWFAICRAMATKSGCVNIVDNIC